jgi:hypothetical protein
MHKLHKMRNSVAIARTLHEQQAQLGQREVAEELETGYAQGFNHWRIQSIAFHG